MLFSFCIKFTIKCFGYRDSKLFILTIISGQYIPKVGQNAEGDIVDPYVKVKIIGHPLDYQKLKTEPVRNNGKYQIFNNLFYIIFHSETTLNRTFPLSAPQIVILILSQNSYFMFVKLSPSIFIYIF